MPAWPAIDLLLLQHKPIQPVLLLAAACSTSCGSSRPGMEMPLSSAGHRAPHVHPVWAPCAPPARALPALLSTAAVAGAAGPRPARGGLPASAGEWPGCASSCWGFKPSGSLRPGRDWEFPLSGADRWALQALPAWAQLLPAPAAAPSPAMVAVAVIA